MNNTIKLNGEAYPFGITTEGQALLTQLQVNLKKVENGNIEEVKRYAYCIAAGATRAKGKTWNFTVDSFIKAAPANWQEKTIAIFTAKVETETKKTKKEN